MTFLNKVRKDGACLLPWRGWSRVTSAGGVAPAERTDGDGGAVREMQRCSAGRDLVEMQRRSLPVDLECAADGEGARPQAQLQGRGGSRPGAEAAGERKEPSGAGQF